jgi:mannose-6-phosphate isomerase-like protein (cupin superfamily)
VSVPVSRSSAEHYTWGAQCDGWHLVRAEGLSVFVERKTTGDAEKRLRNERARQFFYVLAGRLDIEVDGIVHSLEAGIGLEVAPGVVHQVFNRGGADVDFLVVSQPSSHGDREPVPSA